MGDSLPFVRRAIGDYLNKVAGTSNVPLTPEIRKAYKDGYGAAAACLAAIGQ